ncbi:MAG: hypothetical protein IZT59_10195 [Verrucomicrobia bacterium]|nr:hypothetical protein [Verrucomicrobiota bacterium]
MVISEGGIVRVAPQRAWGILSVVFAVVGIVVGGIAGAAGGALVGGIVGGGAAAVLNHFVAKALGTGKIMIDPATNQQVMLKKSNSLFFIPMSWFTVIFATAGILIGISGMVAGKADKAMDKQFPGKAVFEDANDLIDSHRTDAPANGNTPAAEKAARAFGTMFKEFQSVSFEGGADKYSEREFLTYCRQGTDGITFLCQVPGMRKYKDDESKNALAEIAWITASKVAKEIPGSTEDNMLTVGLRGIAIYDSVRQGTIGSENPVRNDDKKALYKIFDPANLAVE